ncbi:MAG: hypothetical protein OXC11_08670 [Rhodospirillales bacterium]|nr:hypothetical protein [Rhodospirillales bacterium]
MTLDQFIRALKGLREHDGGWQVRPRNAGYPHYQALRTRSTCMCPVVAVCHASTGAIRSNETVREAATVLGLSDHHRDLVIAAADGAAWIADASDSIVGPEKRQRARAILAVRKRLIAAVGAS